MKTKLIALLTALTIQAAIISCQQSDKIFIKRGDITKAKTQAIVNAANAQLSNGLGVCGAIFNAAGADKLTQECHNNYPAKNNVCCPTGSACITDSCHLKNNGITHIIHAVGPDCRIIKDAKEQDFLLQKTYKNSLIAAELANITSITFPFISSGIYGFDKKRAAKIALQTVRQYLQANPDSCLTSIHFMLFSQEDFELFCAMEKTNL
jgi:O-acetyl-ADP-ribose deacetylase